MPRTAKPQRGPWRRFTLKLFWALLSGSGLRPFIYALRLGLFVLAMLPGFVPYFLFYLLSPNIKRGVAYGDRWRQTLDVYLPQKPAGAPVVVFVSGGAWIIGNKAWAFLMGQTLQRNGVVCVSVDYRNYPQAAVPQMVDDVDAALRWTFENIEAYGGDPARVALVGQSAGAHLAALVLLRRAAAAAEAPPRGSRLGQWLAAPLPAQWVGISGMYDMAKMLPALRARGLGERLMRAVLGAAVDAVSPAAILSEGGGELARALPPCAVMHGTDDQSVDVGQSRAFADALRQNGATVDDIYFAGKSHTDPILEDPLSGGPDRLMETLLEKLDPQPADPSGGRQLALRNHLLPRPMLRAARYVNPF